LVNDAYTIAFRNILKSIDASLFAPVPRMLFPHKVDLPEQSARDDLAPLGDPLGRPSHKARGDVSYYISRFYEPVLFPFPEQVG